MSEETTRKMQGQGGIALTGKTLPSGMIANKSPRYWDDSEVQMNSEVLWANTEKKAMGSAMGEDVYRM